MYKQLEQVTRCFWIVALILSLAMLSHCIDPNESVSAAEPYHWAVTGGNNECQIYVIYGQAPQDDHITFQVEVVGTETGHSEYLFHHKWEVAPLITAFMQESACNVMWLKAEG